MDGPSKPSSSCPNLLLLFSLTLVLCTLLQMLVLTDVLAYIGRTATVGEQKVAQPIGLGEWDRRLFFAHIDFELQDQLSLNGTLFNYLLNYKNPCWLDKAGVGEGSAESRAGATDGERLRCLPYFYVIGVAKSGTTDLFHMLRAHPDIAPPVFKETNYWHMRRFAGYTFSAYLDLFANASENIQSHQTDGLHNRITFDNSPSYLWNYSVWRELPGQAQLSAPTYTLADTLYKLRPSTRIVVILRDPVNRLYSHYNYVSPGKSSPSAFHELISEQLPHMSQCLQLHRLRECLYNKSLSKEVFQAPIRIGLYEAFLQDWFHVFPRQQVFIIRSEDYYRDRRATLTQLFEFLEVDPMTDEQFQSITSAQPVNSRQYRPMLQATRSQLERFYRPFNDQLARELHDDRFTWRL